jgi:hypothetical protein
MPNAQWSEPVEIEFDNAGSRTVRGPFDALIYLHDMWPRRTGAKFVRASNACKGAVEGRVSLETAREDFLAAAAEARLTTH